MYAKDGTENFPVCFGERRKWGYYFGSKTLYGPKVKIAGLEPFVARLVRALALCGMFTNFSCDGWHSDSRKKRLVILFKERYSMFWFKTLLEGDEELNIIDLKYYIGNNEFRVELTKESLLDIYMKVNLIAEILYRKRKYFQKCKFLVIEINKGRPKTKLTDEELLSMFRNGFREQKDTAYNLVKSRTKEQEKVLWYNLSDERIIEFIQYWERLSKEQITDKSGYGREDVSK